MGMYFEYALGEVNENKRRYNESIIDMMLEINEKEYEVNAKILNENSSDSMRSHAFRDLKTELKEESYNIKKYLNNNEFAKARQSLKRLKENLRKTRDIMDRANKDEDAVSFMTGYLVEYFKAFLLCCTIIGVPIAYAEAIQDYINFLLDFRQNIHLISSGELLAFFSPNRTRYERLVNQLELAIKWKEREIDAAERAYKRNK